MANRCLFHKTMLEDFKVWLSDDGWVIEEPKGYHEVLRAKKDKKLVILFKGKSTEHYSARDEHMYIVRTYLKHRKMQGKKQIQ